MEELKKKAGVAAAQYVSDGMVLGLGTGSTARYFVEEVGRRVQEEGLCVIGVTTSSQTTAQAESLGIPLKNIDEIETIDLTVDGADEVDSDFNGIKGGGGALLMEKIVATLTEQYIWVVDESKLVTSLGAFKLPVEVVQYGAECLFRRFQKKGYRPSFRSKEGKRFVTDMQNFIIDLDLQKIENPWTLADELDRTVGVVEHGLFNGMVDQVIVADKAGIKKLNAPKKDIRKKM
ncbi:ribose-5-phosphate isomerase RpiA [Streptococcus chenjunshii]|uniref:Ribose-5-phosphate isomerase A n=1 Tax=Streptococcus chenjunshii TaxID=2173853 RepID=A0A372KRD7_9STRE|nr:ribose-5-phosphate isomerase RpiA [Streptococcus chenjunshii]AXQ78523.1 ribose-5-phosphate isomerase RpiA [Streptococcus chenjunshii]RFU52016.1 ribose-5-phosphate isomerase RpiA [Streptococcus chenjunshii]RFU54208.1 ribose-5-phosphate isomerase RpiA [Streptococcus chenjunshii]